MQVDQDKKDSAESQYTFFFGNEKWTMNFKRKVSQF